MSQAEAPSEQASAVFTYGTLEFPEVLRRVVGRSLPGALARLEGYRRSRLAGVSYPGIRADGRAFTTGTLYTGVDHAALARLDAFESDFYEREWLPVSVIDLSSGTLDAKAAHAWVYVVPPRSWALLEDEAWDPVAFRRDSLPSFLDSLGSEVFE